ncbi:MAG: hypothetical protein RI963_1772 [Planctomycetota bacterium]
MLILVLLAVAASGYLISGAEQRIRYPDLKRLLELTRYESYGSQTLAPPDPNKLPRGEGEWVNRSAIRVPSLINPAAMVELRLPQDISIADGVITGTVEYKTLLKPDAKTQRAARDELLSTAIDHMRVIAHRMVQGFPQVRRWDETDDIVQGASLRLARALDSVGPVDGRHILGLIALQVL